MRSSDKISKITNKWFIEEPIYYITQCLFRFEENDTIPRFATESSHIYYNPFFVDGLDIKSLEEYMKLELIRVLLKHPFGRYNKNKDSAIAYMVSNAIISSNITFKHIKVTTIQEMVGGKFADSSYEVLYRHAEKKYMTVKTDEDGDFLCVDDSKVLFDSTCSNVQEMYDATKYWNDDMIASDNVERIKDRIGQTIRGFGTIPSGMIEKIISDEPPMYDYREALRCFRHSVVSSSKRLTRMKPNRRYGYEQMGGTNMYKANLLVVCDASGSMTSPLLSKFLGFVNNFFKYGINSIDVVTFDTVVYDKSLTTLKKRAHTINCVGRGGTKIDDILDYVNNRSEKKYDGVVVFTDGGYIFDPVYWAREAKNTHYVFCVTDFFMFQTHKKELDSVKCSKLKITFIENE